MPDATRRVIGGNVADHGMSAWAQRYADAFGLGLVAAVNFGYNQAEFIGVQTSPPCMAGDTGQMIRLSDGRRDSVAVGPLLFTQPWHTDPDTAWSALSGGAFGVTFVMAANAYHFPDGTQIRAETGGTVYDDIGVLTAIVDCGMLTSLGSRFDLVFPRGSPFVNEIYGRPCGGLAGLEFDFHFAAFTISEECGGGGTGPPPPPPPPPPPKGLPFAAIETDGPRQWIHVGAGSAIATYDASFEPLWSATYKDVNAWKKLRFDPRRGTLTGLAIAGKKDSLGVMQPWHSIWVSTDGGQTARKVNEMASTSSVLESDSERGWLLWLTSAQDPDDDTLSNAVSLQVSKDGGETWGDAIDVKLDDGTRLNEVLLDTCRDCRTGGRLGLIVASGGLLVSDDAGESFRRVR